MGAKGQRHSCPESLESGSVFLKINAFFSKRLRAPLHNHVWSWGAVSPQTGDVFFRVGRWGAEQVSRWEGMVTLYKPDWDDDPSPGAPDRLKQIDLLSQGSKGYAVMFDFTDAGKIASYDDQFLLELGKPVKEDGYIYAKVKARIAIDDVVEKSRTQRSEACDIDDIVARIRENTERQSMINSRIGQGPFRESVLRLWDYQCALTGSTTVSAIRASHIKPWRLSTSAERLDPFNGIPLLATFDALFDRGLITFDKTGKLLISTRPSLTEQGFLVSSIFKESAKSLD